MGFHTISRTTFTGSSYFEGLASLVVLFSKGGITDENFGKFWLNDINSQHYQRSGMP